MAFSCGARLAFKLKEQGYLRDMLSRRQLQGFVGRVVSCRQPSYAKIGGGQAVFDPIRSDTSLAFKIADACS